MTPKLSKNMQVILNDSKANIKLNRFLDCEDVSKCVIIKVGGSIFRVMNLQYLHNHRKKN